MLEFCGEGVPRASSHVEGGVSLVKAMGDGCVRWREECAGKLGMKPEEEGGQSGMSLVLYNHGGTIRIGRNFGRNFSQVDGRHVIHVVRSIWMSL